MPRSGIGLNELLERNLAIGGQLSNRRLQALWLRVALSKPVMSKDTHLSLCQCVGGSTSKARTGQPRLLLHDEYR